MDYIKKVICLEGVRTRTQGLMPYYEIGKEYEQHSGGSCYTMSELDLESASGENGNWGQIVANPCFLSESGKTYQSMLSKYYDMLNMVRNGIKLRKVETKNGEIIFTEDIGAFEWAGNCFSGGTEPDTLYEYAAYRAEDFISTEIDSLREETRYIYRTEEEVDDETDFIVLINEYDKFQGLSKYLDGVELPSDVTEHSIGDDEHTKWADYCMVVDDLIGKINIPASIFKKHIKVPKSMPCADVEPYIEWLENYQSLSADCCNARLWDDMGGEDMLEELRKHQDECEDKRTALEALEYSVPYLEMPILLVQNFTDIGVLTNIDGVEYDGELPGPVADENDETRPHGEMTPDTDEEASGLTQNDIDLLVYSGIGVTIDQIIMGTSLSAYPTTERYEAVMSAITMGLMEELPDDCKIPDEQTRYPVEVESQLETLRGRRKYTDDKDNVLPGLFQYFEKPSGKMYRCIKQSEDQFFRIVVATNEIVIPFPTLHRRTIIRYEFVREDGMTKDAMRSEVEGRAWENDNYEDHFYSVFPGVPPEMHTVDDTDPNYEAEITRWVTEMSGRIETAHYTLCPFSYAAPEWRMETDDVPDEVTHFMCGDGLPSEECHYPESEMHDTKDKLYRTITTCAAGIRIAQTEEEENAMDDEHPLPFMEHYYFKVKYDNSEDKPMTVPYEVGNTTNVYLVSSGDGSEYIYRGDFIIGVSAGTEEFNVFEVEYVIGGYFKGTENGEYIERYGDEGDVYYEKHQFDARHVDYVALDGVDNVPVWSEYVDFNADAKEFYSPRYNLYRTGNTANIISMGTGNIWDKDFAYDAYLTKEDYLTNFSLPPKVDVNVTVDRGGVSAFEKHYKLAECNTMQDLENYHNGEFFPD